MSKRTLERWIDELNDDILGDLDPGEWSQIVLQAQAADNEHWIDRLVETCPRSTYRATERAFTDRARLAQRIARHAVYELHTTYLRYAFTRNKQYYIVNLGHERDEVPSDEEFERIYEVFAELQTVFAKLYISYHVHRRFATEVIGVDLETWLAIHYEGATVSAIVADTVDDRSNIEHAESYFNRLLEAYGDTLDADQIPHDDQRVTLNDVAGLHYERLASIWEEAITELPN
ncbi:hypothetical protein [Halalkalicoccus sp. NIPERK01]|uniref:hypothetical protein n=1 Tax=Halalkalicoccus sp. NIPERK01 TaxID=3053469 RepID=UPI00256EB968|nr:hypothetical protein [Halalkalicoccus sp. NIPERK01]MDL5363350.1 hypothetical protein [Halalkalicoccus sp. NIPERK01]